MIKIVNAFFCFIKMLLLLACFVFSFFIIVNMYERLDKNMGDIIFNFIPYILLFILFSINLVLRQKSVNGCLFYNVTCCLVFVMILFCAYRTFCDKNMIIMIRLGYGINFNYFADIIAPMKSMLYLLSVSNVLLMLDGFDFGIILNTTSINKVDETPKSNKTNVPVSGKTTKKISKKIK